MDNLKDSPLESREFKLLCSLIGRNFNIDDILKKCNGVYFRETISGYTDYGTLIITFRHLKGTDFNKDYDSYKEIIFDTAKDFYMNLIRNCEIVSPAFDMLKRDDELIKKYYLTESKVFDSKYTPTRTENSVIDLVFEL